MVMSRQTFTTNEKIDLFLTHFVENKGKSVLTAKNYGRALHRFQVYLKQIGKDADDVDLMEIEAFTGPFLNKAKMGAAGRSAAVSAIRQFYLFCVRRKLLKNNSAQGLEHPKREQSLPGMLSLDDMEKLMFAPDLSTFIGLRDAAMMAFMFSTGCRVSGITGLNEDQLSYGGEETPLRLYVVLKEKGKKSRKLPINRKCELLLFTYLQHDEMKKIDRHVGKTEVVFVNLRNSRVKRSDWDGEHRRLTHKSVGEVLKKHGMRVGISPELLHVHASRHTMGTMLYEEGLSMEDRMAWLGHERPETLAIYTRLSEKRLLRAAEKSNPLSRVKTPIDQILKSVYGTT